MICVNVDAIYRDQSVLLVTPPFVLVERVVALFELVAIEFHPDHRIGQFRRVNFHPVTAGLFEQVDKRLISAIVEKACRGVHQRAQHLSRLGGH